MPTFHYTEQNGSGTLTFSRQKLQGQRIFRLYDYRQAPEFILDLMGGSFNGTHGIKGFSAPDQFLPNYPLYAVSATSKGLGSPTGSSDGADYDGGALITVTYETLPYDPTKGGNPNAGNQNGDNSPPGAFMTEKRSTGAQTIVLSKKDQAGSAAWKWSSDSKDLADDSPDLLKVFAEGTYSINMKNRQLFPAVNTYIGCVNTDGFPATATLFQAYDPGTLLFLGDESERTFWIDGSQTVDVTLNFAYKSSKWNYFYRPGYGFDKVLDKTTGKPPYTETSFALLLSLAGF